MEQGVFNFDGIEHESVDTTCAAEIHRRWRNKGGHEDRCVAEQSTGDKLRTWRRGCVQIEGYGKVGKHEYSNIAMNGVNI